MNEITNEAPEVLGMVEILDENGQPTGVWKAGEGETTQPETAYVAEDHADHVVA